MHPSGASRNNEDQAIFSNDGPNLSNPAETNNPRVIPKMYRLKNNKNSGSPRFKMDIPKSGEVNKKIPKRPKITDDQR